MEITYAGWRFRCEGCWNPETQHFTATSIQARRKDGIFEDVSNLIGPRAKANIIGIMESMQIDKDKAASQ